MMGLSRREFAKSEGCTEGTVRNALKKQRLVARPDGTLDASQLGGRWTRNRVAASQRVKREAKTTQVAPVTQTSAQIPADVSKYYGWDDPWFNLDAQLAMGLSLDLGLKNGWDDPESIALSMALHAASSLQREAYRLGWREDGPVLRRRAMPIRLGRASASVC
jgi:hypothetical protein